MIFFKSNLNNLFNVIKLEEEEDYPQREPGLYQGGNLPGRSFKILQAMTQPENAGKLLKFFNNNYTFHVQISAFEIVQKNHHEKCDLIA